MAYPNKEIDRFRRVIAMAPSSVCFRAAALALLLLCSVSACAADVGLPQQTASAGPRDAGVPSLEDADMSDPTAALAVLRQYIKSLDANLSQVVGAEAVEWALGAEGTARAQGAVEKGRILAAEAAPIPLRVPKFCPKKGCDRCPTTNLKSPCRDWICCARDNAFNACAYVRLLTKKCRRGTKFYKEQCVQIRRGVLIYGSYLGGLAKKAAKRCKPVAPFNDILGQVRKDLANIYKRCC